VDKLRCNPLYVSQLVDADLDVHFHKSSSWVLDTYGNLICDISRIGKVFQADFLSHPVSRPKLNAYLYVCQDQVSYIKRQIVK
jgi:hypothetical protein